MNAALKLEAGLRDIPLDEPRADPFRWFTDLETVTRPRQLVKGVIPAGCLVVGFGESGSGKTFFFTDMALHIAGGVSWRGRKVNGGLVVYIAAEAAGSVSDRVTAWRRMNPLVKAAPFAVLPGAVNLLERQSVDALIADILAASQICKAAPALVVFDTLARCIAGADENSAADVGEAVASADRVRTQTGATVLLVHHSGKDVARGARGSSALRAAVDVEIAIEGLTGTRTATVTKSRDGETGAKSAFDLEPVELGTDEDGDAITSLIVRPAESVPAAPQARGKQQAKLLAALEDLQGQTEDRITWTVEEMRQIARDTGMHRNSARDAVLGLMQIGVLTPSVGGSYLTTQPARNDRKRTNRPISVPHTAHEMHEGSIDPVLPCVRPVIAEENS